MEREKCRIWYCFRKAVGYLKISAGSEYEDRLWYCGKHGRIAQEIIKEKYPDGQLVLNKSGGD